MTTQTVETTFYTDDRGIRVTNSRLVFGDTTYSMANLTSVAVKRERVSVAILILFLLSALVWLVGSTTGLSAIAGLGGILTLLFAVGFIVAVALRQWKLTITSSSGESSPIASRDKRYIDKVAQAIQEALIARG
jgi:hypothetical protein